MQTSTAPGTKKLLIGNLTERTHSTAIHALFDEVGKVVSVAVLAHGFAFVEMQSDDADRAIRQLKGHRLNGKVIMIDEAHPRRRSRYE